MKVDRLFALTNYLVDRREVTAAELAREFGVSIRTIYRDIDILSTNGIPILTSQGKGGGISIMEGYTVDRALLSDEDQNNILAALQSMSATGQEGLNQSIQKMQGLFQKQSTDWIEIDFTAWNQTTEDRQIFEEIRDSILYHRVISFSYYSNKGKKTKREVEPLKLYFRGQNWYVWAYCRKRQDYRFFKLSRMEEFVVSEETYSREPESYDKKPYSDEQTTSLVTLKLAIDESMAFRVYDELRSGEIQKRKDGFVITIPIPKDEHLYTYLLGYGNTLEVLEPEEIRKDFAKYIKKIMKKY